MKKTLLLFLLLLLLVTGCTEKPHEQPVAEPPATFPPVVTTTAAPSMLEPVVTDAAVQGPLLLHANEFVSFEPDILYPISHVLVRNIAPLGDCVFVLRGYYGAEYEPDETIYAYTGLTINSIEIKALEDEFHQIIDGFSTAIESYIDNYGLEFADWNSDGAVDIKLRQYMGGSMRNEQSLFWLWDDEQFMFVENEELEGISCTARVYLDPTSDIPLQAYTRANASEGTTVYYEYINGSFVCVQSDYWYVENDENGSMYWIAETSKLIDGELQIVEETREKHEE